MKLCRPSCFKLTVKYKFHELLATENQAYVTLYLIFDKSLVESKMLIILLLGTIQGQDILDQCAIEEAKERFVLKDSDLA